MTLSTLLFLAGVTAPAPQEPLAAHPADAAILVQVPDMAGLLEAYAASAYGRILADEELHEALGRVMGTDAPMDPRDMALEALSGLSEQGLPPFARLAEALQALSFSVSVEGGDFAAFLIALEHEPQPEQRLARELTVRTVLDFKTAEGAAAMSAAIRDALAEQGAGFELEALPALGGVFGDEPISRLSLSGDDGPLAATVRMLAGGRRIALLVGGEEDAVALGRMAGTEDDAANGATRIVAARQGFQPGGGAVVFEASIQPFLERVLLSLEPMSVPAIDVAEALVGPLVSIVARGGDWRVSLVDGQFVTEGVYPKSSKSPFSGLFGSKPLDPADLALVMPDAVLASAVSLDKNVLARVLERAIADQGGEEMLAELDASFGFRPDRDLIAPLGDAVAYSLSPVTSLVTAPPFSFAVDVEDLEAFTRGVDGVFRLAESLGLEEFQLKREEYRSALVYSLSFVGVDDPSGMFAGLPINPKALFRPTLAIGQGRAFLITTPSLAKKEVRRVEKLGGELQLHPVLTDTALLEGTVEFGYADWAEFVGRIYTGVKGLASMAGAFTGELPFDLASLPEAEVFTRHLVPSFRTKRLEAGGWRVFGRSSFGPELPLAAAFGGLGAIFMGNTSVDAATDFDDSGFDPSAFEEGAVNEAEVMPAPYEGPEADHLLTQDMLLSLKVDLTVHRFDHGAYPATLAAIGKGEAADAWGRGLVYKVTQTGFQLYSLGPNGVDDGGAGDDILPMN